MRELHCITIWIDGNDQAVEIAENVAEDALIKAGITVVDESSITDEELDGMDD